MCRTAVGLVGTSLVAWFLVGTIPRRSDPPSAPQSIAPEEDEQSPSESGSEEPLALPKCGCAAVATPTRALELDHFTGLLDQFATEPIGGEGPALEQLLFYGEAVRNHLRHAETPRLDPAHRRFLDAELARTHARLELRVRDLKGRERIRLTATRIPLGVKQHLHDAQLSDLQPLEVSVTLQRVGLRHLWARL